MAYGEWRVANSLSIAAIAARRRRSATRNSPYAIRHTQFATKLPEQVRHKPRRIPRHPPVRLANAHPRRFLSHDPRAQHRTHPVELWDVHELLKDVTLRAILARRLEVFLHRVDGDVRALTRQQRL